MGHDSLSTELIYYFAEGFILVVSSQWNPGLHYAGNSALILLQLAGRCDLKPWLLLVGVVMATFEVQLLHCGVREMSALKHLRSVCQVRQIPSVGPPACLDFHSRMEKDLSCNFTILPVEGYFL
jgi:hypothetical protein